MSYKLIDIKYETPNFWVLDVGRKGYEVYRNGATCSVRVASIGHGTSLGLPRAIAEADKREAILAAQEKKVPRSNISGLE